MVRQLIIMIGGHRRTGQLLVANRGDPLWTPQVVDVAVVGAQDAIYGEEVMACLVLHPEQTLTEEAFKDWCRANMASYKVPIYVDFRMSLPKNILGKVLKKELKSALKSEGKL